MPRAAMTKVQVIKTEGGEELIVLPAREYERLIALAADEDVGTARLVDRTRAAMMEGSEPVLPKGVVDQLAEGANPIRTLRDWRRMTQAELGVAVGVTQGYLSDLESGKRKGPLALHQKIARALGIPIDLLLPVAVSEAEADPERWANRSQAIGEMQRRRRRRP